MPGTGLSATPVAPRAREFNETIDALIETLEQALNGTCVEVLANCGSFSVKAETILSQRI